MADRARGQNEDLGIGTPYEHERSITRCSSSPSDDYRWVGGVQGVFDCVAMAERERISSDWLTICGGEARPMAGAEALFEADFVEMASVFFGDFWG